MNYLEAQRILRGFAGGPALDLLVALSGTPNQLEIFLRAAVAARGHVANLRFLPFNTLRQALFEASAAKETEVFVLLPWDYAPALDWRSGHPEGSLSFADLEAEIDRFAAKLARRSSARLLYLPAPFPPVLGTPSQNARLSAQLLATSHALGAEVLTADWFGLSSYLSTGNPIRGTRLGDLAMTIANAAMREDPVSKKVLVTDLDGVFWRGVVGEDGVEGINCAPEGLGYPHFIYQTVLGWLERHGVLLSAVSRNDPELALSPFRAGKTALSEDRFVSILASYEAKSAQIGALAQALNLGLDAFVFVDDNPIELAEVGAKLPGVVCLQFPATEDAIPQFLAQLKAQFARASITAEDRERTTLYRRQLGEVAISNLEGADLTDFLRDLDMSLIIHDRSEGDRTRAVQLINKTNQFNMNGRRVTDEEVERCLAQGGHLFTATLSDRTGSHGEILACLITGDGLVESFVLSCRVFQRRVEHAFMSWLMGTPHRPRALRFASTPRNEPFRQFIGLAGFSEPDESGEIVLDNKRFVEQYGANIGLFRFTISTHNTGDNSHSV